MSEANHTLMITRMDDFEAEHAAAILRDYCSDMLAKRIDAMAAGDQGQIDWIDGHLAWHNRIMTNISWSKS